MSNITPTGPLAPGTGLGPSDVTSNNPVAGRGADGIANVDGWFGDNLANAPLIDVTPPAHFRNLSTQELANEVLQHIMQ